MTPETRRLLVALGHDPERVEAVPCRGRTRQGLRVTWRDSGKLAGFYTDRELRQRGKDAAFLAAWEAAG